MKMIFENAVESDLIEHADASGDALQSISINTDVRHISMNVLWASYYNGLRLYSEDKELIIEEKWYDHADGDWTSIQDIPEEMHIIGFKCYDGDTLWKSMRQVGFLLGKIGEAGISGEIRFPPMETYPSSGLFQEWYTSEYPALSSMGFQIEQYDDPFFFLAGISLTFADGTSSGFLGTGSETIEEESINVDQEIEAISIKLLGTGISFVGIRLYHDVDGDLFEEREWHDGASYVWTSLQNIPAGQSIIGVDVNTEVGTVESQYGVTGLSFILSPVE